MDDSILAVINGGDSSPSSIGECVICGGPALHKHFGNALSCNSCCAFFRRTVSMNKSYTCKMGKHCDLRFDTKKHMCQFCRFRRCLAAGMQIAAVTAVTPDGTPSTADTPLRRVMLCRRAIFINRFRATAAVYGGQENVPDVSGRQKHARTCEMALRAEYLVICEFLKTSGVLEQFDEEDNFICRALATSFLYTWMLFESACHTVRNFGHHHRKLYFVDESYIAISESSLEEMYLTDPTLLDYRHVMRHGMSYYTDAIEIVKKLASSRLDETEQATLVLILLVHSARKLASANSLPLAPLLDSAFRNLKTHYEENYEDVALRMDNVVQLAHEFQRIRYIFDEHVIIMRLYGKQTVQAELDANVQSMEVAAN